LRASVQYNVARNKVYLPAADFLIGGTYSVFVRSLDEIDVGSRRYPCNLQGAFDVEVDAATHSHIGIGVRREGAAWPGHKYKERRAFSGLLGARSHTRGRHGRPDDFHRETPRGFLYRRRHQSALQKG
jgi:hypothetical protein